jgi:hypothetical protein
MAIMTTEDSITSLSDQLVASGTALLSTLRASRVIRIPDETIPLFLQIRTANGTTNPASNTTFTLGTVIVEQYATQAVSLTSIKPQPMAGAAPVSVQNTPAVSQSGTWNVGVSAGTNAMGAVGSVVTTTTDIASAAITTTTTTAALTQGNVSSSSFVIPVTAVSGTNPTMDVSIEESYDSGTNYVTVWQFPRITATGVYHSPRIRFKGNRYRFVQTIGGTTPSFTRSLVSNRYLGDGIIQNTFYDRSIVLNTASSTTAAYFVDGTNSLSMVISVIALTTAATVVLQGSQDSSVWVDIDSLNINAVGQFRTDAIGQYRFIRAFINSAGTGITLNYICLQGRG